MKILVNRLVAAAMRRWLRWALRTTKRDVLAVLTVALAMPSLGCATAPMDKSAAAATATPPVQNQVEVVSIPRDPALPTFVIAVEPFAYSASGQISGGGQGAPIGMGSTGGTMRTQIGEDGTIVTTMESSAAPNIGPGIAAQFTTALMRAGNVSVLPMDGIAKGERGTYTANMMAGEVGPYILRGTVTEFAETSDASGKSRGASLGGAGVLLGITGALTGNRGLTAVGGGVAAANPTYFKEEIERTGVIGMDLQLIDGRTGRIVGGYNVTGTFTTLSKVNGASLFGIGGADGEFAASALGQATRAAMNDALTKTVEALRNAPR